MSTLFRLAIRENEFRGRGHAGDRGNVFSSRPALIFVRTAEQDYVTPLPAVTEESLMHEELSILGRDPVFERVLT